MCSTRRIAPAADSFRSVDSDFQMVWDPTADRGDQTYLYPGDDVVDVIGRGCQRHRKLGARGRVKLEHEAG